VRDAAKNTDKISAQVLGIVKSQAFQMRIKATDGAN
jgi:hypothetical protein